MTSTESAGWEDRFRRLEDRAEIQQLLASYGPGIDSGSATDIGTLWEEDGTYIYSSPRGNLEDDPISTLDGRADIEAMLVGKRQQYLLTRGSAHLNGAPHIKIHGDTAVAINYSMLVLHDAEVGRNYIDRVGTNRWELVRTPEGWRVLACTNSLLDGRVQAREILREAAGRSKI